MAELNPPNNPRRGVIALAAAAALVVGTVALVVGGGSSPAAASELATFTSCEELSAWGEGAMTNPGRAVFTEQTVGAAEDAAVAAPSAAEGSAAGSKASGSVSRDGSGTTNVAVEGVDELDLVDRLDQDRVLIAGPATLSVVDLAAAETVDSLSVPNGAQITFDTDARVAWVVGQGDGRIDGAAQLEVQRVTVAVNGSLSVDGRWTTPGSLVDARRVGDRLHLVAIDAFAIPDDSSTIPTDTSPVPFADGPVPCDQVLHPVGSSVPTATLLVTLPVSGPLEPEHATEVVGAGAFVHVTTGAAYLATPLWDEGDVTAIHRFDLADLTHTGSGRVEGHLLDEFSMSEVDGNLRVAVTIGGGGGVGPMPMPMEGPAVDRPMVEAEGDADGGRSEPLPVEPTPVEPPVDPMPVEPGAPAPPAGDALNEIVVLDTGGDLNVIGRTARFGHPGETLHGIRFTGDVAYAVTFLQTDPFYVIDLSQATSPEVVGEVELPGFSSYLHPISDSLVVGFGPDGQGQVGAKLFDVSDASRPRVVDELALGAESPVAWEHHAFLDLGDGRFAVPASTYREQFPEACTPAQRSEDQATVDGLHQQLQVVEPTLAGDPSPEAEQQVEDIYRRLKTVESGGCLYPQSVAESAVVVVDTAGGLLSEENRLVAPGASNAQRVIEFSAGWALLGGDAVVLLDQSGNERATLALG